MLYVFNAIVFKDLIALLKGCESCQINYLKDKNGNFIDLDLFTFFGTFNRDVKFENRITVLRHLKDNLTLTSNLPSDFDGIPTMNNQNSWFYWGGNPENEKDITKLNELFIIAISEDNNLNIEEKFRNKNIVDYVIKDGIAALSYTFSIVKRILHNNKIKVLVVDDSKTFVEQTKRLLQKYRFQALTALNGEEALKLLEENRDIKIVLTDYLMPKINGLELTKRIRKEFTKDEISVIIVSNDLSRKIPAKFLKYGANDFIYKGFSNEEFFARINSNIEILELFDESKISFKLRVTSPKNGAIQTMIKLITYKNIFINYRL